jgi:choline kinase
MILLIPAAGSGKRLGNMKSKKPKILLKINGLSNLERIKKTFYLFKKKIFILGYRKEQIIKELDKKSSIIKVNKKFKTTNMVESIFLPHKHITEDLIIVYSDIIFDIKILKKLFKHKGSVMPVNGKWYSNWKNRMSMKKVLSDAENIIINDNKLISIGGKIKHKLPSCQFMGIIKFKKNDYFRLRKFYKSLKDKKLSLTVFLDMALRKKILVIRTTLVNNYWTEIDTINDYKFARKKF